MKRIVCLLLAVMMLFSLSGCADLLGGAFFLFLAAAGDDGPEKEEVFAFVCENEEQLLKAIEDGDLAAFENQGSIRGIDANDGVVDFSCGGAGMGSGTSYVGFYYTPDHDLTAVWCAPSSADSLTACGDGFEWREKNGDNHYYTEPICGNFYYYEFSS